MSAYTSAKDIYANIGVDTEAALAKLDTIPISVHCWQGDDVRGFEGSNDLTGGIQSTGSHPGWAKTPDELRAKLDEALALIPGPAKVNLHAVYGDVKGVERNAITTEHFKAWVDWAVPKGLGLDFNQTLYSHPKAADGLTLSHPDAAIRAYWIEHCKRCRKIGEYFGQVTGQVSVVNLWAPDGFKDIPADQLAPRARLKAALDEIFQEKLNPNYVLDAVESKLFGIGVESYTTGSHEFYMGYAAQNDVALCIDAGHFHPTEVISAKISAISLFIEKILLHVSRPVRWDSDHVVLLDDELLAITHELVRHKLLDRVHIGMDFFDGSIDRVMAWAIGARNVRKALLVALLEPYTMLQKAEESFDFTQRLLLQEEKKMLPWQAIWNEYCNRKNIPERLVL